MTSFRLRSSTWLLITGWLILLCTACSALDAPSKSVPVGTVLLTRQTPFNLFTVAWSPDGTRLALGGANGAVQIRDATTGALLLALAGHTDSVWDLAWSPDGTRLASASWDHTVQVWEAATGKHL